MNNPVLYRKRYVPMETIVLKEDHILFQDAEHIVTKWNVFRPKANFSQGISCYFLKEGYKVSKFMNDAGELVYYYCDIIETDYDAQENSFTFTDLLVDVVVQPSGMVEVLDLAEAADALEQNIITIETIQKALRQLEKLLQMIYTGQFDSLTKYLEIEAEQA